MFRNTPIIDADARVVESPFAFRDALDADLRERLRLARNPRGAVVWEIEDRSPSGPHWRSCAAGAFGLGPFLSTTAELGAVVPRVRQDDMQREGIETQVLYPTLAMAFSDLDDPDLAVRLCRAYNDHIAADCRRVPRRLVPVGVLPLCTPEAAVEELRHCVVDLDMPAVVVPPGIGRPHPETAGAPPSLERRVSLADLRFAALYETAEYLDAAIVVHAAAAGGAADRGRPSPELATLAARSEVQDSLAELIVGGVFERFARLRFGFFGVGGGWLPDFIYHLGNDWRRSHDDAEPTSILRDRRFAVAALRAAGVGGLVACQRRLRELRALAAGPLEAAAKDPVLAEIPAERNLEEYFARDQIFVTVSSDDPAPAALRQAFGPVGERLACWTSGYGSGEGGFAGCVERTTSNPQVNLDYVERLLHRNALRLYGDRLKRRLALP